MCTWECLQGHGVPTTSPHYAKAGLLSLLVLLFMRASIIRQLGCLETLVIVNWTCFNWQRRADTILVRCDKHVFTVSVWPGVFTELQVSHWNSRQAHTLFKVATEGYLCVVVTPCLPIAMSVRTFGAITAGKQAAALVWKGKNKHVWQQTGELPYLSCILINVRCFLLTIIYCFWHLSCH